MFYVNDSFFTAEEFIYLENKLGLRMYLRVYGSSVFYTFSNSNNKRSSMPELFLLLFKCTKEAEGD